MNQIIAPNDAAKIVGGKKTLHTLVRNANKTGRKRLGKTDDGVFLQITRSKSGRLGYELVGDAGHVRNLAIVVRARALGEPAMLITANVQETSATETADTTIVAQPEEATVGEPAAETEPVTAS